MNLRPVMVTALGLAAACGGKSKPAVVKQPEPPIEDKAPPPPPPPVCVPATEPAMISTATSDGSNVAFCASDGGDASHCFAVGLADGKYGALDEAPAPQSPALESGKAYLQATPTEVKVCVGGTDEGGDATCTTLKPKVAKGASEPITAVTNGAGTLVVAMLGNGEAGKGVAEVWDVAKKKKTATIKYAKGDYKCGAAQLLGDTVFISASVCAGPDARGALYSSKGKKLADVGGKDFGTFGTEAVQIDDTRWAFLEEGAGTVAIQDVTSGAVSRTIDLVALWAGDDKTDGTRANGNPGESALVRGGPGELVVIAGSPAAGSVGVITTDSGELKVWKACAAPVADAAKPADEPAAAPADEPTGE